MSISQNFPEEGPTLNLNFAGSKTLDPRITFSRTTTGTYMDANGLIVTAPADAPRFDHRYVNGEIESLGLLVEEERSNLATYSNGLSSWGSAYSHTLNQDVVGPDGITNSAWTMDDTYTGGDGAFREKSFSVTPSTNQYCFSVFAKSGTAIWFDMYAFFIGSSTKAVYLNYVWGTNTLSVGSAENSPPAPTIYGKIEYPNGWNRFYFVFSDPTGLNNTCLFRLYPSSRNAGYVGSTLFYGAQIEEGAFPTSYIPRPDASTATREPDRAVIEGSNFTDIFNTNFEHFSMFVNYDNTDIDDGTNYSIIQFWGESTNFDNRVEFYKDNDSPYHIETRAFGGGSAIFSNGNLSAGSTAATQKLATSWSVDYSTSSGASRRWAFSFNGESVDVVNDATGTTVPSLTRIGFGINPTRTDFDGGKIHFKQISLYSNTLTDSQLQTLTK